MRLIILLLLFNFQSQAVEVTSNNLKTLLEQKNSRILSSKHQIQAAKEREGILMRSFMPSLRLSASQESIKTGISDQFKTQPVYGADATLNLYNGGRDSFESEIRKTNTQLHSVQAEQILNMELQKVRSVYWEILYLKNKAQLLNDAVEINKSNTSAATRRIRSGVATNTDQLEFDMEAVNLKRELEFTGIQLNNATNMLYVLLNFDASEKLEFKEELLHEHEIDAMFNKSANNFEFQYKNLELTSELNNLHASKEKRSLLPKIDAFASYYQFNQREKDFVNEDYRDEYAFGLRITLDLPAGLKSNRDAASYYYQAKSAEALAHIQKKEVETHMVNERNELNFLHEQVHNADENIKRAQAYYKATQSEYNRGVKNSPDVLAASQRFYEMKHKRLEIVRDFQVAKGHLMAQMGK